MYNILTKSPKWKSTLLLITYDEHGGIYDHVVPPTVTCKPENCTPARSTYRAAVQLRLHSPWNSRSCGVCLSLYPARHHHQRSGLRAFFGCRNRPQAVLPGHHATDLARGSGGNFENVLTLEGDNIRNDVVDLPTSVTSPGVVNISAAEEKRGPTDLSVLIAKTMHYSLQARGIKPPADPDTLTTAGQVATYLRQASQLSLNPTGSH